MHRIDLQAVVLGALILLVILFLMLFLLSSMD